MNNLIQKIKTKILKNKKNILFVVFFMLLLSVDNSFAEEATKAAETSKNSWYIPLVLISALTGFLGSIIGIFISPDWTTGQIFGLTDALKQLWVLVSNVVYFIFAFMLIAMAFMNIIGHGKNEYEMKTALPKFIVGILIVPFSWFIVQFVVSITSILTVSVLSLPYDLFKNSIDKNIEIKTNCTLDLHRADKAKNGVKGEVTKGAFEGSTPTKQAAADKVAQDAAIASIWRCTDAKTIDKIYSGDSLYSIMSIYTYGILKIDVMDTLKGEELKNLSTITDVFIKLGFDLIFLVVYFLLLLAIAMALFVRGVYLWLFMMLSPTFGLFYFLGDKKGKGLSEKYSFTKFLELALVPVYVSAALSFGLLFVFIASPQIESGNNKVFEKDSIHLNETDTFTITGLPGSTIGEGENKKTFELGSIGKLLMVFISLAVLWIAVMAALNSAEITKSIVEPISKFGDNVGSLVKDAPKYAPILPGGMSMEGLKGASSTVESSFRTKYGAGSDVSKQFAEDISNKLGIRQKDDYLKKLQQDYRLKDKIPVKDEQDAKTILSDLLKGLDLKNVQHKKEFVDIVNNKFDGKLKSDEFVKLNSNQEVIDYLNKSENKQGTLLGRNDIDPNEIRSIVNGNLGKTARSTASTDLPKGIDTSKPNQVIINHYSGTGGSPQTIKIDGKGNLDGTKVTEAVDAFNKNGFEHTHNEHDFRNILESAGIKNDGEQTQIIDGLKKARTDFFTIKTNP